MSPFYIHRNSAGRSPALYAAMERQTRGSVKRDPPYVSRTSFHTWPAFRPERESRRVGAQNCSLSLPCRQYPCHPRRLAVEIGRGLQPVLVGIPGKHELSALETIDHHARHLWTYRRAALAATDATLSGDPIRIHVVRGVDDDGTLAGQVIHAGFKAIHAQ